MTIFMAWQESQRGQHIAVSVLASRKAPVGCCSGVAGRNGRFPSAIRPCPPSRRESLGQASKPLARAAT